MSFFAESAPKGLLIANEGLTARDKLLEELQPLTLMLLWQPEWAATSSSLDELLTSKPMLDEKLTLGVLAYLTALECGQLATESSAVGRQPRGSRNWEETGAHVC